MLKCSLRGNRPDRNLIVPLALHDLPMARLGYLRDAKTVAPTAGRIGREHDNRPEAAEEGARISKENGFAG